MARYRCPAASHSAWDTSCSRSRTCWRMRPPNGKAACGSPAPSATRRRLSSRSPGRAPRWRLWPRRAPGPERREPGSRLLLLALFLLLALVRLAVAADGDVDLGLLAL